MYACCPSFFNLPFHEKRIFGMEFIKVQSNAVVLLACGCFNPPTNMHLRMFEIAKDHLQEVNKCEVVGGIISPVHDSYGKKDLESSTHRLNMINLALQDNNWIKLSDWEANQETWSRTKQILQYHQNHINSVLHSNEDNLNEADFKWLPEDIRYHNAGITVKLLCGADLLESFGTPGLWSDDDIEAIVGQHGLVVITRSNSNPNEFIYNSDILTKYRSNITIVTEWIQNEISSTKIRKAFQRSESVKYLIPDKVIDYIHKNSLYGANNNLKKIHLKNL
ncbi:nicotinamide/nicotinic acid mononucleotide adenylyltransferase 3 [Cylas formicarius]|uniref:nicotinamide/nicotinic acid mononucleotide adenylyltransferase 3 n=1 Tax=Cylas formicarius TaxID=197179 RepID=UPI0029589A64|nr:nicotinamide/nicotinic acid mononucleotide adenylyltransferase 3 [Cylas formicarius]